MSEIILGLVIVSLVALLVWEKKQGRQERLTLLNALMAKTPEQFRDLELTAKVQPIIPPARQEPDFIPESDVTDKKFQELINQEVA